jgi:methylthioribose-1-phosphate isomerase
VLAGGAPHRTLWVDGDGWSVRIIDQTKLPHAFETLRLSTVEEVAIAIRTMQVRGAPLIGVAAAYGLCLALRQDASDAALARDAALLLSTRPTAVNLRWALETMRRGLAEAPVERRAATAYGLAAAMAEEDVAICQGIGSHGVRLIRELWERDRKRVNVLTHCNAGWLATIDWGTALAPVFRAHEEGIPVHVWVDETRPRSQGFLTAWELRQQGIPHTIIADNVGGHLMQHGLVDLCLVGSDRTTAQGDVCNKIGTYLKALAASDNGVPFYVGLPSPTIDWTISDGVKQIPIEQRDGREVHEVTGRGPHGVTTVTVTPEGSAVANYAFDVTPARLVTGLITERGVCAASREGLLTLFPERRGPA